MRQWDFTVGWTIVVFWRTSPISGYFIPANQFAATSTPTGFSLRRQTRGKVWRIAAGYGYPAEQ
jgi:hypothetical protein